MSEIAKLAEDFTCLWLKSRGWKILEKNYRTRRAEVDVVAVKNEVLAFVEVKFAGDGSRTMALEKVNMAKQGRLTHAASAYLAENPHDGEVRFDVAVVRGKRGDMRMEEYIPDAFRPRAM